MIILSPFGDIRGRRWLIVFLMFLWCVGISMVIVGIYKKLWVFIIMGQLLNGTSVNGLGNTCAIITGEFIRKDMRKHITPFYWAMWSLGLILFLPIYYFMP